MISEDTIPESEKKINIDVDIQVLSSCERRIKVTIPRTEIDRYFEVEFDELTETAYVPGFRQGMAPRKLVEKRFKKEIGERVKSNLVMDSITQVNESPNLTPIGEPDLNFASVVLPDTGPMIYEFNLEVRPEFDLPQWKGLTIKRPVREFTEEDVNRAVEQYLTQFGRLLPSESPAESGDYIVSKLIFRNDGEIVSQANEETLRIRPVLSFADGTIKDFDKLMAGVKAGDVRTAKAQLSEDSPNPALRGKEIEATFEILDVKKLELPELSSEFLERAGGFENVGDFRDAVLDSLKQQLAYEQRQQIRQQITQALTVAATWELPPTLLERQAKRELDRMIMELKSSGYTEDAIQREINYLRQNSRIVVANSLKEHFVLEKIAEVENIEPTERDYDMEIALIAAQSNTTPRRVRAQLEKQEKMDILRNQVIERKVIDRIEEHAKFVEVPYEVEGITEEAVDRAAGGHDHEIHEATEDDLKAAHREEIEKKMIDPNVK
ncbi:MAG: trigger factor [Planctomycetaceae bacterium]|nr:trigger factor [Planctomycetaceae bacterium]